MTSETHSVIALNTIAGLKGRSFTGLLARFGTASAALAAPEPSLRAVPGVGPETAAAIRRLDAPRVAEQELARAERAGVSVLTLEHPGYPERLRQIADPPPVLYFKGALAPGDRDAVAVVGSRTASAYGRAVAERISRDLAGLGVTVVSGLARGIDGCAHRGALAAGGRTLAVLGSGLAHTYPAEHRGLAAQVARSGALVSEFSLGTRPDRWHFPLRNRVVSGLSRGVVVVEAAEKSGALITADTALEQGREVFAVPGNVTSPASAGTNRLIKQGAKLVEGAADILEEFPDLAARAAKAVAASSPALTPAEAAVLDRLGGEPLSIDEIIRACPLPAAQTTAALTALELRGMVRGAAGKRFARA